jgi:glycosyltransferase involved in cell wall biosynthesis
MIHFPGKLALQQRVLPNYRVPFFELLNSACDGGMSLFTGLPRPNEGIKVTKELRVTKYKLGENVHLFGGRFYLCYQKGLRDWLEEWNPSALIVEANLRYLSTPSVVKWMHKRNKPVIGWGLGSPPVGGFRKQRRLAFINHFDAMISYSQRGADEYAALGFPRKKIFVAHNAVSAPPPFQLPARPLNFDPRPCILFVGRLQARKRIDHLLKACSQLEMDPRLVIVGDGPERESLESLARKIHPSAEFIGALHGVELKPYFTEADLFILPGTGGLAVQEAMSYGLPIIVAQGDGTQDDLVGKGNGWQVSPDDFESLLSTMNDALSDVARLRKMGEESYRIALEEINIEKMVQIFVEALNSTSRK